jgi:tol-pal system protein YbgF
MKWGYTAFVLVLPLVAGCVTVADFRKVQRDVTDLKRNAGRGGGEVPRERLAELAVRVEALEGENEVLRGRLEVAEHRADEALREARAARQAGASGAAGLSGASGSGGAALGEGSEQGGEGAADENGTDSAELAAYRDARATWSQGNWGACIDQLGEFLQTYPSSVYVDDAAYWRADCYFQQGNYKMAILRFDYVVANYPNGNKAADALYRQGEALVQLGHAAAARVAFERVLAEYPDSERVTEASQQLKLL